jgi:hypothetical protein
VTPTSAQCTLAKIVSLIVFSNSRVFLTVSNTPERVGFVHTLHLLDAILADLDKIFNNFSLVPSLHSFSFKVFSKLEALL